MTSLIWDEISLQIKQCIYDQKSLLSQFPPEAASITTREVVLSLHVIIYNIEFAIWSLFS